MNTEKNTNAAAALLTHDLVLGPDLRRDRYRSGRDRIVANVLYFLPWFVGYFGWDRVREAASGAANATAVLAPVAVLLVVLASAACLVTLRRYCVYPAADSNGGADDC